MTTNVMYNDMAGIQAHLSPSHLLPKIGSEQHKKLEANFRQNRNPSDLDVTLIAAEVGLDEEQVKMGYTRTLVKQVSEPDQPKHGVLKIHVYKNLHGSVVKEVPWTSCYRVDPQCKIDGSVIAWHVGDNSKACQPTAAP